MLKKMARVVRPYLYKMRIHNIVAMLDRVVGRPVTESLYSNYSFIMDRDAVGKELATQASNNPPFIFNWIIDDVFKGSGGHTTIFRVIRNLEKHGHKNRVYVHGGSVFKDGSALKEYIKKNFFPLQAEFNFSTEKIKDSDATVATYWETAYFVRRVKNTGKKFYLVQDYEPYFCSHGSNYEMAKNTYDFGFYGITVGSWLSEKLSRENGMKCTPFNMSYDKDFYSPVGRSPVPGKKVLFYAQPFKPRRGFELGMVTLNDLKTRMPEAEIYTVGGTFSGYKSPFEYTDLGVLPYEGLAKAYRECDAALVLSLTNLSLLPLELMASKCAVVSNRGPNVEFMLKDGFNCLLADSDPYALSEALYRFLTDEPYKNNIVESAYKYAIETSWDKELDKVEKTMSMILQGLK